MSTSKRSSPKSKIVEDDLRSQRLLKEPLLESCKFTDPEVRDLFLFFPSTVEFRAFDALALSDSASRTWVCFPALPFQLGLSYPFPPFTRSFFLHTGISYPQAMPMLWRTLYTIEEILKTEKIDFGLPELSFLYSLVTHGSSRFILKSKPHKPIPILKTTQNDTLWRNQFFFVRRDSIPDGKSLPFKWVTKVDNFSSLAEAEGTEERVEAFLRLDQSIRSFKPRIQESFGVGDQEHTATSSPKSMSSAQKSGSKSVTKFSLEDVDSRPLPKSGKKDPSKTSTPIARVMPTRAKSVATKRKKPTPSEDDSYAHERKIHEVVAEVHEIIRAEHDGAMKELQQSLVDLRTTIAAKDKSLSKMAKEKKELEEQLVATETRTDEAIKEAAEEAKNSAFKSILQARIKLVEQAMDPNFDRSNWKVEEWKQAVIDLSDVDDVPVAEKMDEAMASEAKDDDAMVANEGEGAVAADKDGCADEA